MRAWRDVEDEQEDRWYEIPDRVYGGLTHTGLCPSCGQAEIRYFYWRFEDFPGSDRGGLWIWCPACLRYSHFSARVPQWWRNLPGIAYDKIESRPEWLEEHWDEVLAAGHPQAKPPRPGS